MATYPLFLKLEGRTCLVVGGGTVGLRKATSLLEAGALVRLVCLEAAPSEVPTGLEWITAPYSSTHLVNACLVYAAANTEVNRVVVVEANARGIWVNSATNPEDGDFLVPASARSGKIEIAVSTGGASPAVAAYLRDHLASNIDNAMIDWVEALAALREEIQSRLSASSRSTILRELADPKWLDLIRSAGVQAVEAEMRAVVNREANR